MGTAAAAASSSMARRQLAGAEAAASSSSMARRLRAAGRGGGSSASSSGRGAAPATESDGRRLRDERGHPAPRPFPCMTPDEEVLAWSRMREAACRQLGYPHPDARHGLDFARCVPIQCFSWLLNIQLGSALGRMHILSAITECFDALNRTESWLVQPLVF